MKQGIILWVPLFLWNPRFVRGECYGVPEYDFSTPCRDQYSDCESCVIGSTLHPSCRGWCPQSGMCAGGFGEDGFTIIQCADTEVAYEDWCPVNTANPAFDSQDCIVVSWEWYACTQIVDGVGSCDANYATSYCEMREQQSSQLCNGNTIQLVNPDYPFGGLNLGYFAKNPAAVQVKFGGQGLYITGCYKFVFDPVTDDYMCAAGDTYALKYSLSLDSQVAPAPVPTNPPATSPISPAPSNPPVALPVPPVSPQPVPTDPPQSFSSSPQPVPIDPPHSFSSSPEPVPTDPPRSSSPEPVPTVVPETAVPKATPVMPPVILPVRLPTKLPTPSTSLAYGASLWAVVVSFSLAWFAIS